MDTHSPPRFPSPVTAPKNSRTRKHLSWGETAVTAARLSHLGALGDLQVGDVGQGGVEAGRPGAEGAGVCGRHVAVHGVGLLSRGQSHDLLRERGSVRRCDVATLPRGMQTIAQAGCKSWGLRDAPNVGAGVTVQPSAARTPRVT